MIHAPILQFLLLPLLLPLSLLLFPLLLPLQLLQSLSPADLEKIAASDSRSLMVYGAYGIFITLSGAIIALYKAYRDEVRENRAAHDQRLTLFMTEVQANKERNREMVQVLLDFSRQMAEHVDSLKVIVPLVERHERDTKESRRIHEERIQELLKSIHELLAKRSQRS